MKNFFLFVLAGAFFSITSVPAQVLNDSGGHGLMRITTKQSAALSEVNGSPYLYDDFKTGMITLQGKDPLAAFLRYDVNTETFEIKTGKHSEDIYVLPVKPGTKYHIGAETYVYKTINYEGNIKGYFLVHYEGENVSLLEKPSLTFVEPTKARTGYDKDKPGQILLEKDFYLVFEDGTAKNIRLKEKDFEKAMPSSNDVKKYFSDNKLKTLEDFIAMLKWYDQEVN